MNHDEELQRIAQTRANLAAETQSVLQEHQAWEEEQTRLQQVHAQETQSKLSQLGAEDNRLEGEERAYTRLKELDGSIEGPIEQKPISMRKRPSRAKPKPSSQ